MWQLYFLRPFFLIRSLQWCCFLYRMECYTNPPASRALRRIYCIVDTRHAPTLVDDNVSYAYKLYYMIQMTVSYFTYDRGSKQGAS